jgi:hypothetical protein
MSLMSNKIQASLFNSDSQDHTPQRSGSSSYVPTRKVGASAFAGALTILLVWIVNNFILTGQTQINGEVASALTTVLASLVGYFVPEA